MARMGTIESNIKSAIEKYQEDGNLLELLNSVALTADYSVRCANHAAAMYDALRKYCPKKG